MDWFLYDSDLRHERANKYVNKLKFKMKFLKLRWLSSVNPLSQLVLVLGNDAC